MPGLRQQLLDLDHEIEPRIGGLEAQDADPQRGRGLPARQFDVSLSARPPAHQQALLFELAQRPLHRAATDAELLRQALPTGHDPTPGPPGKF